MRAAKTGIISAMGALFGCGIIAVASIVLPVPGAVVTASATGTPAARAAAPAYRTLALVQGDKQNNDFNHNININVNNNINIINNNHHFNHDNNHFNHFRHR
jgi:hypothetical protein